ncbi:hypothetical protein [Shimia sagamensis]|uniref:Uncharacterized protein n=1 Tax=Shimia sagamensis TaxID=1566352 RepID=A0ABY1PK02_9RHOB|nr:hypothetical protein [Shimia sagamensis]SMP35345.1 hypothetical protein SAMN06265373_11176 [Shimia sagamensis]
MFDDITDFWRSELQDALAPFRERGVTVSVVCEWVCDQWVRVAVHLDHATVIDARLFGLSEGAADDVADLLWRHRIDLLRRLRGVGANPQSLAPFLARAAWRGPSLVAAGA